MRKKLIDSSKSDLKKYMMIVESAGKVPASTEEDFTLEDIENPYFQGDEESEGNRYYVTVGVKIGGEPVGGGNYNYFPELIWDIETGTEIEFDKLDKISKKAIQDKCNTVGSKMSASRLTESDDSTEFTVHYRFKNKYGGQTKEFVTVPSLSNAAAKDSVLKSLKSKGYRSPEIISAKPYTDGDRRTNATNQTDALGESTQIVVKALMQKFQISESRAKQTDFVTVEEVENPNFDESNEDDTDPDNPFYIDVEVEFKLDADGEPVFKKITNDEGETYDFDEFSPEAKRLIVKQVFKQAQKNGMMFAWRK